jgi:hypothetical protein
MEKEGRLIDAEAEQDELVYEPVAEPALDQATGLVPESLWRRGPERTIQ